MIAGTAFHLTDWRSIEPFLRWRCAGRGFDSYLDAAGAQCAAGTAAALSGPDGVLVVELQPRGAELVMFILAGAGATPGSFRRCETALVTIARDLEASWIAFRPRRRGWQRLLDAHWAREGSLFVRRIDGQDRQGAGDPAGAGAR